VAASERSQHPLVAPVAFLLGVWEGEGQGLWSAEPRFRYRERVEMSHQAGAFVAYHQTTTTLNASKSLHTEAGFIRPGPGGTVEMVVAQATGLVEVHAGMVSDERSLLTHSHQALPDTGPVAAVTRKVAEVVDNLRDRSADIGRTTT
jgi:hypothetical protein